MRTRKAAYSQKAFSILREHWRKIRSTKPLERLKKKIKRRTNVVGIFPNDSDIIRLVSSQLLEQQEVLQMERRRFIHNGQYSRYQ